MASLHRLLHLLFLFLIPSAFAARGQLGGSDGGKVNPLTPKAAALRYWSQKVPDRQPRPEFLVSKLSPLTVQNMAELQRLADGNALSTKLSEFCSWANLSCLPDVTAGQKKHAGPRLIHQVTDPSKNFYNGRENHPNPYYYHPNPYYYGRENKEGGENHPNHPNPYYYHPNPYYVLRPGEQGRRGEPPLLLPPKPLLLRPGEQGRRGEPPTPPKPLLLPPKPLLLRPGEQ